MQRTQDKNAAGVRTPAAFSFAFFCIVFRLFSILGALGLFSSDMLLIFNMVQSMIFLRDSFCEVKWSEYFIYPCLSTVSLSRQRHDTLYFSCCPLSGVQVCMWHWPICKDLDLTFIWGHHHMHLVDVRSINRSLPFLLHRVDETQQGRNSCPRLQFLAFSLDSIMSLSR